MDLKHQKVVQALRFELNQLSQQPKYYLKRVKNEYFLQNDEQYKMDMLFNNEKIRE